MDKLELRLDELQVDSFTVSGSAGERGTVEGYYATIGCTGSAPTCNGIMTCDGNTCNRTYCNFSCDSCPCVPPDVTTGCDTGAVDTQVYTCGICNPSVNEANTCIAPCTPH